MCPRTSAHRSRRGVRTFAETTRICRRLQPVHGSFTRFRRHPGNSAAKSNIQRLVVAEDAVLVERNASVAREIPRDLRSRGDAIMQFAQSPNVALESPHPPRKSVAQPRHELEQREIDISELAAGHVRAAALLHQSLEITEIFRHALLPEFARALL